VTRRSDVLFYSALFTFCSLVGVVWGVLVRTPDYPSMSNITVYPSAQALVNLARRPTGVASPVASVGPIASTTATATIAANSLTRFGFRTSDNPDAVLSFYREELETRYGFILWKTETSEPGATTYHFLRETDYTRIDGRGGYDREYVTVEIKLAADGATDVRVLFDSQPYQ
jgi:hypothetical protein